MKVGDKLTNLRNAPLFIISAPPQLNLLNRSASIDPPQSIRLNCTTSISNNQVINDNTSACLRQVEVLGPKCSRVIQYLKYSTVSKGSYTPGAARSCASNSFMFFVLLY